MFGVIFIEFLFFCVRFNDYGVGYEFILVEKRSDDSEFIYFDDKGVESGVEEVKILGSNEIFILDFKEFNYGNCFLFECIFLMQFIVNFLYVYS